MSDKICVGSFAGSYGVQGEIRLKSYCAVPEAIADYGPLTNEDGSRSFSVTLVRPVKNGFVARTSGITNKEAAEELKGLRLFVDRATLPSLPDDEYYHSDLIGLSVVDTGGTVLGEVLSVENHGAADLLEIRLPGQSETILLPFTQAIVPTVDLQIGRIVADPPDGLFPDG